MLKRLRSRIAVLALGAAWLALGPCVSAQTLGTPTTLEFGEVSLSPSGGSITLDPATGAISSSSGVYPTASLPTAASAIVATDKGTLTATVYTSASSLTLTNSSGASFSISTGPFHTEFTGDTFTFPGTRSQTTTLTFHIGGTLPIPAGQAAGDYTGSLPVFVQDNQGHDSAPASVPIHIRIVATISLTNIADLDLGTIIPGATAGTVTLNPATGALGITGGVLFASASGQPAQFTVAGQPNHPVSVTFGSTSITLTGSAGSMSLSLAASPSGSTTLNASGNATLGVGGTLSVAANQAEGDYVGTIVMTVAYP